MRGLTGNTVPGSNPSDEPEQPVSPAQKLRREIGLPPRAFLYTLDQIADLISVQMDSVRRRYIHFNGRSVGPVGKGKMLAHNIAPEGEKPDWRVTELEFLGWLKSRGFRYYERGYPSV